MDISAVLTGAKCKGCGSQTHQRNDRWYKDETCKRCGNTRTLGKSMSKKKRTDTKTRNAKGTRKGSSKGKSKSKKRTPDTCLCCGKTRHKKTDRKFLTATCSNCEMVGDLRAVCRNTNTHTHTRLRRMQMNRVQKSLSKQFGAWLFETLSTMVTVIAMRSATRVQNIVTSQRSQNSQNIVTNQNSEESSGSSRQIKIDANHHEHRDGSKFKNCCNVWMTNAFLTHHEKAVRTRCHKVSRSLHKERLIRR